jgi:hypothetical protein
VTTLAATTCISSSARTMIAGAPVWSSLAAARSPRYPVRGWVSRAMVCRPNLMASDAERGEKAGRNGGTHVIPLDHNPREV